MTERKELTPIYARFAQEWIKGEDGDLYIREEVDPLLDKYEARIKELEANIKAFAEIVNVKNERIKEMEYEKADSTKKIVGLIEYGAGLQHDIKKLEARIKELEEQLKEKK